MEIASSSVKKKALATVCATASATTKRTCEMDLTALMVSTSAKVDGREMAGATKFVTRKSTDGMALTVSWTSKRTKIVIPT